MSEIDARYMGMALALAERGLGNVWPNPAVGCVLVKDGRVVGRAWTQPGGRPHAESEAIGRAGATARGSTAYVTLEPCAHHRRTPPCADLMVAAGIARAAVAAVDPDPRVDCKGIARLRAAGVAVEVGCRESEACPLNAGLFTRMLGQRAGVALKLATSAGGKIARPTGESMRIAHSEARAEVRGLRLRHDAILVGSGMALADNPPITCRLPGRTEHSPVRIVLNRRLRLAPATRLVCSAAAQPAWLFKTDPAAQRGAARIAAGVELFPLPRADDATQLGATLAAVAEQGATRLLVEGGATMAKAFLRAGLVDRLRLLDVPMPTVDSVADHSRWRSAEEGTATIRGSQDGAWGVFTGTVTNAATSLRFARGRQAPVS